MKILDKKSALGCGYRALTSGYRLPRERGTLDRVLADMRRGNISHVLVRQRGRVAVWRRGSKGGQR